ncbi:hypothetical protein TSAR_009017 [Trichomalopsis sarcophagae]|uniref:Odorant receptor n=1 Tax=Trichomalopsis sarcophagae TaxID=543379 RepID=A0A232FBC9_9HYME|nr:hypothetical protein TSAR_009017 [Trichomalopsis sarcophagae]
MKKCIHMAAAYLTTWFFFSGVDTTFVLSVKHTHRLDGILKSEKSVKFEIKLIHIDKTTNSKFLVIIYNLLTRYLAFLENLFNWCFLVLNCMTVIVLAMIGVYLLYIYNHIYKMIRIGLITLELFIHLLYINWVEQMLIDKSEKVFETVYFSNWYFISTKFRIFAEVMINRSIHPCPLTAGKITVSSMIRSFGIQPIPGHKTIKML